MATAGLVFGASKLGVRISTTHVSCGAIFEVVMVSRTAFWKTITQMLTTWPATLKMVAVLGSVIYYALSHMGYSSYH